MEWTHSRIMSTAGTGDAVVVFGEDGWQALPFGLEGGPCGIYPTREQAIEMVESMAGDVICCVGHLAADSNL
ncbi:MAG: hypothetical protein KIT00_10525 [Rhodospirillales bacterium]|nr:hypothetical protein [Rhodospirillales bacterium]